MSVLKYEINIIILACLVHPERKPNYTVDSNAIQIIDKFGIDQGID